MGCVSPSSLVPDTAGRRASCSQILGWVAVLSPWGIQAGVWQVKFEGSANFEGGGQVGDGARSRAEPHAKFASKRPVRCNEC